MFDLDSASTGQSPARLAQSPFFHTVNEVDDNTNSTTNDKRRQGSITPSVIREDSGVTVDRVIASGVNSSNDDDGGGRTNRAFTADDNVSNGSQSGGSEDSGYTCNNNPISKEKPLNTTEQTTPNFNNIPESDRNDDVDSKAKYNTPDDRKICELSPTPDSPQIAPPKFLVPQISITLHEEDEEQNTSTTADL